MDTSSPVRKSTRTMSLMPSMPTTRLSSSTTGRPLMPCPYLDAAASYSNILGRAVTPSRHITVLTKICFMIFCPFVPCARRVRHKKSS